MSYSKYGNEQTEYDGRKFDSKAEKDRYVTLSTWQSLGAIEGLECQKKYVLCKGRWNNGKPFSISYIADFVYILDGETVVEDVKGYKTEVYELKKKLMKAVHGIEIQEVHK